MYVFSFVVKVANGDAQAGASSAGEFRARCWAAHPVMDAADLIARTAVSRRGWSIERLEYLAPVGCGAGATDPVEAACIDEANRVGYCLVAEPLPGGAPLMTAWE